MLNHLRARFDHAPTAVSIAVLVIAGMAFSLIDLWQDTHSPDNPPAVQRCVAHTEHGQVYLDDCQWYSD